MKVEVTSHPNCLVSTGKRYRFWKRIDLHSKQERPADLESDAGWRQVTSVLRSAGSRRREAADHLASCDQGAQLGTYLVEAGKMFGSNVQPF